MKAFGGRRAVDGVDVDLADGERLAVVGPNGAGKSTLLRMMATLLRPDAGELRIAGAAVPDDAAEARRVIGYLGHDPLLYLDLTAWQNLELYAGLYGMPDPRPRIGDLLEQVGLLARAHESVRTFSRGMAQRAALARMLLHDPRLLLLDEPYASLDAAGSGLLDAVLEGRPRPPATVLVTHDVEHGLAVADRVLVLRAGRPVLLAPTHGLEPRAFRARYEALVSA